MPSTVDSDIGLDWDAVDPLHFLDQLGPFMLRQLIESIAGQHLISRSHETLLDQEQSPLLQRGLEVAGDAPVSFWRSSLRARVPGRVVSGRMPGSVPQVTSSSQYAP